MLSLLWKVFLSWKLIKALLVNKIQNKYGLLMLSPVFPYCHLLVEVMCARNKECMVLSLGAIGKHGDKDLFYVQGHKSAAFFTR